MKAAKPKTWMKDDIHMIHTYDELIIKPRQFPSRWCDLYCGTRYLSSHPNVTSAKLAGHHYLDRN